MSESSPTRMQLVSDGKAVRIELEPPVTDEQERFVRDEAPLFQEIPAIRALLFRERQPTSGKPYTEIDCSRVHTGVEEIGFKVDEVKLATEIAEVLREHGSEVMLDTVIKPIEQSGHRG